MLNKKLLLLQDFTSYQKKLYQRSTILGEIISATSNMTVQFNTNTFGRLDIFGTNSSELDILLNSSGSTSSEILGIGNLSLSTILNAVGRLNVGGSLNLYNNFTLSSQSKKVLSGASNLITTITLDSIGKKVIIGTTNNVVNFDLASIGNMYADILGSASMSMSALLNVTGRLYIGGSTLLSSNINFLSNSHKVSIGRVALSNSYLLNGRLVGILHGSSTNNLELLFNSNGVLSSEVIELIAPFDLIIDKQHFVNVKMIKILNKDLILI